MSPSWGPDGTGDGSPQPSLQHQASVEDEQMIRHLASRYSPAELTRLFQKISGSTRLGMSFSRSFFVLLPCRELGICPGSTVDACLICGSKKD